MIKRDVKKTPVSIIDKNNEFQLGVFDTYFQNLNFKDYKRPLLSKILNNSLLTEWQAVEVLLDDLFLIAAVLKFNVINKTLLLVYDRKNDKLFDLSSQSSLKYKSMVSSSLENGSKTIRKSCNSCVDIINNLQKGEITLKGYYKDDVNGLKFNLTCHVISKPSNVVIPMTEKHVVYTEKDFLKPTGEIIFNGVTYKTNDTSYTILDDHRGYYPLTSGYDWTTTLGVITLNGKQYDFGLNLTDFYKNLDHDKYNENGIWLNEEFIHLPRVSFERHNQTWTIKDNDNLVDLVFTEKDNTVYKKCFPINIDYKMAIGSISGTIKLSETRVITLNQTFALGEKRNTKFIK